MRGRRLPLRHWLAQAHAWGGLALSLWLMLLGATGTLLAFKDDWLRATVPGLSQPAPYPTPESLAARARAAEAAFGTENLRRVLFAGNRVGHDLVTLWDGGGAYLDPRSGAVVERWADHGRAIDLLFELHHRLLLGEAGRQPVGWVGLALALFSLTGIYLSAGSWRRFRPKVWPANGRRVALLEAHRDLGLIAALPLLAMALTGAALCFPQSFRAVAAWAGAPAPVPATQPAPFPAVAWEAVFARASAEFPAADIRIATWPTAKAPGVELRLRDAGEWHPNGRSTLRLDPADGAALARFDAVAAPPALRAVLEAYAIHSGRIGGRPYHLLVALSGVALTLLSAYGALAYLKRLRRPARATAVEGAARTQGPLDNGLSGAAPPSVIPAKVGTQGLQRDAADAASVGRMKAEP